jgi:ribosomal protein S12 methylthiotransferase accessory factor
MKAAGREEPARLGEKDPADPSERVGRGLTLPAGPWNDARMRREMTVSFPGGKKVSAHFEGNEVMTDQPLRDGGEGTAPSPFDLLLASLATCTGFYVSSFCDSRELPLDGVRVSMSWSRGEGRPLGDVDIRIETPPEFPSRYVKPLERAAGHCTVKRTLADPPEVRVRVTPASVVNEKLASPPV